MSKDWPDDAIATVVDKYSVTSKKARAILEEAREHVTIASGLGAFLVESYGRDAGPIAMSLLAQLIAYLSSGEADRHRLLDKVCAALRAAPEGDLIGEVIAKAAKGD